jgi:hypothetical protein
MAKQPTYPVVLNGKTYELRFDIQALTSAHVAIKAMGFSRATVWNLADAPYDLGEELVLLQAGLNGAKRLNKDSDMYTVDEIQEMMNAHFDSMAEVIEKIEDEQEAMKEFQKMQQDLMLALANAVKGAIGFRYKGKRDKPSKRE